MVPWVTPWTVQLDPAAEKDLRERLKRGLISQDDLAVIKAWVSTVEEKGPDFIAIDAAGHWNDHPLFGNRIGQRSSSFSESGRIIYRVNSKRNVVMVLRVTEEHDYSTEGGKRR